MISAISWCIVACASAIVTQKRIWGPWHRSLLAFRNETDEDDVPPLCWSLHRQEMCPVV
jgi:hypothetical protein